MGAFFTNWFFSKLPHQCVNDLALALKMWTVWITHKGDLCSCQPQAASHTEHLLTKEKVGHVDMWLVEYQLACVSAWVCVSPFFFLKDDTLAALTGPAEAQSSLISNAYERASSAVRNSEEGRFSGRGEPSVIIWLSAESEQQFILRIQAQSPSVTLPGSSVACRSHSSLWQPVDSCKLVDWLSSPVACPSIRLAVYLQNVQLSPSPEEERLYGASGLIFVSTREAPWC